jgi:hypothetical protein
MTYPKWLYHKTEEAKIVQSAEEHKKLGPDWKESPAEFESQSSSAKSQNESEASENSDDSKAVKLRKAKAEKA